LLPTEYDAIHDVIDYGFDYWHFSERKHYSYYNRFLRADSLLSLYQYIFLIEKNGIYGLYDMITKQMIAPLNYDEIIFDFYYFAMKKDNLWGVLFGITPSDTIWNTNSITPRFSRVRSDKFINYVLVSYPNNDKLYYLNREGNVHEKIPDK